MTEQSKDVGQDVKSPPEPEGPAKARRGFLGRGARAGAAVVVLTVHHRRSLADTVNVSSVEACTSMGGTFKTIEVPESIDGTNQTRTFTVNVCETPSNRNAFTTTTTKVKKVNGKGN